MEGLAALINCPERASGPILACSIEVSPLTLTVPKEGGVYVLTVTAANLVAYSWAASDAWIMLSALVTSGSGTGTVTIPANTACVPRSGTIEVCDVIITVNQAAAVSGCCDVTVTPTSFPNLPPYSTVQTINVTLNNPTIPSAFTDVSWLHVSAYISIDATHGKFDVTVDAVPLCTNRTGNVMICDDVIPFTQPFSLAFTPASGTISGNAQDVIIVPSGANYASTPFNLVGASKYGTRPVSPCTIGWNLLIHGVSSVCAGAAAYPSFHAAANDLYQTIGGPYGQGGLLDPIGNTLLLTGTACDGTQVVITQVPKAKQIILYGDNAKSISAGPADINFGPNVSNMGIPVFDLEYPVFSSMEWSLPYSTGQVSHTINHWTVATPLGNTATFAGADPGPYFLTPAQKTEVQNIIATHLPTPFGATINIYSISGKPAAYILNPIGATTLTLNP